MVESSIPLKRVASAPTVGIDDGNHHQPERPQLQQKHAQSARKPRSASVTPWSETIRKVLRGSEDQWDDDDDAEPDLVGEEITRILNASPEFKRPKNEEIEEEGEKDEMRFDPLLSSRNLQRFHQWLRQARPIHPRDALIAIRDVCFDVWNYLFRDRPSIGRAARLFVLLLITSLFLLVMGSYMALMWLYRTSIVAGSWIGSLLVDVDELQACCPSVLKNMWSLTVQIVEWVDDNIFFRKRIAGREWNDRSFVWRGMTAKSRGATLWKCPPPTAKDGLLNSLHRLRHDWSPDTVKHILAIDFCYDMLRKENLRKKEAQRRKAMKRAASCHVGMDKRSEFGNYRKAKSDLSETLAKSDLSAPFSRRKGETLSPIEQGPGDHDFWSDDEPHVGAPNSGDGQGVLNSRSGEKSSPAKESSFPLRTRRSYSDSELGSSSLDTYDSDDDISESSKESTEIRFHKKVPSQNSLISETGQDMNWLDVGTRIGIRLLNSEHVQKAIASQDTAERIMDISSKLAKSDDRITDGKLDDSFLDFNMESYATVGDSPLKQNRSVAVSTPSDRNLVTPQRPIHPMWTSPAAVATSAGVSLSSISDMEDSSLASDIPSPPLRNRMHYVGNDMFPPRSPPTDNGWKQQDGTDQVHTGKFARGHRSKNETKLRAPKERRDETEIVFNVNPPSSSESPRMLESFETTFGRKRPKEHLDTRPSPIRSTLKPRHTLAPGVQMVVPIFPWQPSSSAAIRATKRTRYQESHFQMATVMSSRRICVRDSATPRRHGDRRRHTNCLSVTVTLNKSFLRNGGFAEMTFRVLDEWSERFMPKHSKFPVGACVATSYGVGILVSWRVEDDCHVVRSLWQHKGPGRAHAYLNRDAIHGVVEAAVGFNVDTKLGRGTVLAYVNGGKNFRCGRYFVLLKEEGRHKGNVLEFNRADILACQGAEFTPIIEYIREAAQYQILVDNYEAAIRKQKLELSDKPSKDDRFWRSWSKGFELIWSSFLKAIEEDSDFDIGMSAFVSKIINFLERLDNPAPQSEVGETSSDDKSNLLTETLENTIGPLESDKSISQLPTETQPQGFWILDGMFGGAFQLPGPKSGGVSEQDIASLKTSATEGTTKTLESLAVASSMGSEVYASDSYRRAFAVLRSMMRTVSIARASCKDRPNFRLALSICYEFLLFIKTVIKVQQKNVSPTSVAIWKRTFAEIVATFGPLKERMEKIGRGIAERVERQGNRAKVRILRFVDIVLLDERLLSALEEGEWDQCLARLERALVKARIIEPDSREHYHKCLMFIFDHLVPASNSDSAAARNGEKLAHLAKAVKWMASPRRSFLSLLKRDDVLEIAERIFVRVFRKDRVASRMLSIHAANFHSFRHLRMLKDFTVSGKLWIPLLDAADEEFAWAVSRMPDNVRDYMRPLSNLFSLCVAQFHRIRAGDLSTDWLDFLMEDDAVKLIHEIDVRLILGLESFAYDVKSVLVVLPYYPSIDDDFLNLMDEVDFEQFLKEASEAIVDPEGLAAFFKEKATMAIERFLDYLPKMSIPVEQRELSDGWVLTCRGENGSDLKLSDVSMKRENMVCQIMGSDNVFFPMFGDEESGDGLETSSVGSSKFSSTGPHAFSGKGKEESSILDHIRELLLNAQKNGCWQVGVGGVGRPPSDGYVRSVLGGLPVSSVLNCGIELWRNLEIDDDELLEIAIRDVSFQIQLQKEREHGLDPRPPVLQEKTSVQNEQSFDLRLSSSETTLPWQQIKGARTAPLEFPFGRFNPRRDPTVLYLEMNKLTLHLEKFMFRIEKMDRKTIFDPVFEGFGSLSVRDVSIKLRVECHKERINKLGNQLTVPILHLQELDVRLAKVKFKVKDTGADWFLNKLVDGFSDNISRVVEANLKEQVSEQVRAALLNLNSYFEVNPDLMLSILGITMDDLEENIIWV